MKPHKSVIVLGVLVTIAFCVMVTVLMLPQRDAVYQPPGHDGGAALGVPNVPEALDYNEFYEQGMPYRFHVCTQITVKDQGALVFFTNPSENDAWLKLRIMDANGELLGESGIVYPGEYVETVVLAHPLEVGTQIVLKVMGYQSQTYYSIGAVSIQTMIIES